MCQIFVPVKRRKTQTVFYYSQANQETLNTGSILANNDTAVSKVKSISGHSKYILGLFLEFQRIKDINFK